MGRSILALVPDWEQLLHDLASRGESDLVPDDPSTVPLGQDFFSMQDGYAWTRWTSQHWEIPLAAVVTYAVGIASLSFIMRDRDPIVLPTVLMWWNFGLALFSLGGAAVLVPQLLFGPRTGVLSVGFYESVCSPPVYYGSGYSGFWMMLFIYSKFFELVDTVFLVLRKVPLTTLHVWHHITVLLYCWHSYAVRIGDGLWFGTMNYVVHSIMYAYFGATSVSKEWRRAARPFAIYITLLQLSQMVVGIVVTVAALRFTADGRECTANHTNSWLGLGMYTSYFLLFTQFFIRGYCGKAPKTAGRQPVSLKRRHKAE